MRGLLALAIALLAIARPGVARADTRDPVTFAIGVRGEQQPGTLGVDATWRTVRLYESRFPDAFDRAVARPVAIVARIATAALVDAPLGELAGTIQHEVFGHGARGRELGFSTQSTLILPRPYAWLFDKANARTQINETSRVSPDARAAINAGGIEANYALADLVARRAFRTGAWQGRGDAFMYLGGRLVYMPSFFRSTSAARPLGALGILQASGDDVAAYAAALDRSARERGRVSTDAMATLRVAYLWNFFDPLLLSAAVAAARWVVTGEERSAIGALRAGEIEIMPRPSFALGPFGPERGVGVWVKRRGVIGEASVRAGSFGGARSMRAMLRLETPIGRDFTVALSADVWQQPRLELFDVVPLEMRPGVALGSTVAWDGLRPFGFAAGALAKTSGYASGEPLGSGLYAWLGVRVRLPD